MQLIALSDKGDPISVTDAQRGLDYFCPECRHVVRVREGRRLQRHYYHLRHSSECRQSGKGALHLEIQLYMLSSLPPGNVEMERRFPTIGRIADIAWEEKKIVFEVQCAAMSSEEAEARTADYRSIGWQVIWILAGRRYGRWKATALEIALLAIPHYYAHLYRGDVRLYDQVRSLKMGRAIAVTEPRPLTLAIASVEQRETCMIPEALCQRITHWPLRLAGDYLDAIGEQAIWNTLIDAERSKQPSFYPSWERFCAHPYRLLLQWLLERHSSR